MHARKKAANVLALLGNEWGMRVKFQLIVWLANGAGIRPYLPGRQGLKISIPISRPLLCHPDQVVQSHKVYLPPINFALSSPFALRQINADRQAPLSIRGKV